MSPISAQFNESKGAAFVHILYGLSILLSARICFGPNLVPERQLVPISIGMPRNATSKSLAVSELGSLMNVPDPENLGCSFPPSG